MTYYWFPLPRKTAQSEEFEKLRKQGEIFVLYRTVLKVISKGCDLPAVFDPATKALTMLLRGESKKNLYLSTEPRELDALVKLELKDGKKISHSAYMSALRPVILERFTARGLTYRDILAASSDRVPKIYRETFNRSIADIIEKYIIEPRDFT